MGNDVSCVSNGIEDRLENLLDRAILIHKEQMELLIEAGDILWPSGFFGKDGRRLPNPMKIFVESIEFSVWGCWDRKKGVNSNGYTMMSIGGKHILAHRWSYSVLIGELVNGHVIDHLCRNVRCANPFHLEQTTYSVNVLRGVGPSLAKERIESKTHCKRGHPFSGENLGCQKGKNGKSYRLCLECNAARKTGRISKKKKLESAS